MTQARLETWTTHARGRDRSLAIDDGGEGEPVVLLHSSGMSGDQWKRTALALRGAGLRTLAVHLLGSGRSEPWPDDEPFTYLHDVAAIDGLVTELGGPVHLVGHSYGGLVALLVALRGPHRVGSITLYDPVAFGVLDPSSDAAGRADLARLGFAWGATSDEHEAWLASFVDYWGGGSGAWASLREGARAEMSRVGWIVFEGARTLVADTTRAAAYEGLAVPTLLMTGSGTPAAARRVVERLGASIPKARIERFEGAGHMGPLTHTGRFNDLALGHIRAQAR